MLSWMHTTIILYNLESSSVSPRKSVTLAQHYCATRPEAGSASSGGGVGSSSNASFGILPCLRTVSRCWHAKMGCGLQFSH